MTGSMRRMVSFFLWDPSTARAGTAEWWRAKWRFFAALAGSLVLTAIEWVEHHPPEIAIVAVIHFVFVLVAIALVYQAVRRLTGRS